jgi:plastocyanin
VVDLTAQNFAFSRGRIEVPAGALVTVRLRNADGVPHNFAAYTNAQAIEGIASSPAAQPGGTVEVTFTAPSQPGEYFFRCNFHPDFMTGTLVVR